MQDHDSLKGRIWIECSQSDRCRELPKKTEVVSLYRESLMRNIFLEVPQEIIIVCFIKITWCNFSPGGNSFLSGLVLKSSVFPF